MGLLVCWQPASATIIGLEADQALSVKDQTQKEIRHFPQGTISEAIRSDNQLFRLSYGRDIHGMIMIILYPDPAAPESVEVTFQGKVIKLSPDAALTINVKEDLSSTVFVPGLVGTVEIDGEVLNKSPYKVEMVQRNKKRNNPGGEAPPVSRKEQPPSKPKQAVQPRPPSPPRLQPPAPPQPLPPVENPDIARIEPPKGVTQNRHPSSDPVAAIIHGQVFVDGDHNGNFLPLSERQKIPVGSVVKTSKTGVVYIVFSKSLGVRLSPGTVVTVLESGVDRVVGALDAAMQLEEGTLTASLQPKAEGQSFLKVVVGEALLTCPDGDFLVDRKEGGNEVLVHRGEVILGTPSNSQALNRVIINQTASFIKPEAAEVVETGVTARARLKGLLEVLYSTMEYAFE